MKPKANQDITLQGNISGKKIAMGIDESSMGFIMSILTDLYSDPELAIIREYSTNAYDAHREAGLTRPIEVSLPTTLAPFLTIRDYGMGLDGDDISDIYSKYGASTKRNTDEQVGMLGLGCKSALTYTSQFTLTGIKNGVKTTVAISRDENNAGVMTLVHAGPTDEPEGVQVVIPARKPYDSLISKAKQFFSFWELGTVLLNDEEPYRVVRFHITDKIAIRDETDGDIHAYWKRQDYIIMGNVAYPHNFADQIPLAPGRSIVVNVDIGDVNFTPSREALMYTSTTKATLERIVNEFNENINSAISFTLHGSKNRNEALKAALQARRLFSRESSLYKSLDLSYHGEKIPFTFSTKAHKKQVNTGVTGVPLESRIIITPRTINYTDKVSAHSKNVTLYADHFELDDYVFVHNYTADKFTAPHRKKLDQYCRENSKIDESKVKVYILTKDKFPSKWLKPVASLDWDVVKLTKLPRTWVNPKTGATRISGSYDMFIKGKWAKQILADAIDTTDLYYYEKNTSRGLSLLLELHPDATIVELTANRVNKFRRDFPMAKSVIERMREIAKAHRAKITKRDILAYKIHHDYWAKRTLLALNSRKVIDPEVKKVVKIAKEDLSPECATMKKFMPFIERNDRSIFNDEWKNPLDKYPLLGAIEVDHPHVPLYMNAVYAKENNV